VTTRRRSCAQCDDEDEDEDGDDDDDDDDTRYARDARV
jgi:hypothetical protein